MYETSGTFNKITGEEFLKVSLKRSAKILVKIYSLICFLIAIVNIILWALSSMKIFLRYATISIFSVLFLFLIVCIVLSRVKISCIDSIKEISDKGEFEFRVFFNDNGANINNLTTSATFEIKYEFFYRLEETPSMYVLLTKCGQYVLVFKSCLSDEEIKSFKGFIKGKCKNIK